MDTNFEPRTVPEKKRDPRNPLDPSPSHQTFATIQRGEIWDGAQPWVITTNKLFRELISDPRVSNDVRREGYPTPNPAFKELRTSGGLNTFDRRDGEEHAGQRRILLRNFTPKQVNSMRAAVQKHLDDILDRVMATKTEADVVNDLAFPFSSTVMFEMIGIPYSDFDHLGDVAFATVSANVAPAEAVKALGTLKGYLSDRMDEIQPGDDSGLLARFTNNQLREGIMTRDQILDILVIMVGGGYETSANSMALSIITMLMFPDQLADLRANIDNDAFLHNTVEELLRFNPVTHFGRRRVALEDIEIGEITIKAGEGIVFLEDVSNRDPEAFEGDPNVLDIRRDSRNHLSFAFGPHYCPGNLLARLEMGIFLRTLLTRMPDMKLAQDVSQLEFLEDNQVFGIKYLPISW